MSLYAPDDDMNATPLSKLPPPLLQTKADAPRVDAAPSYNELVRDMDRTREAQQSQQAHLQQQQLQQQMHAHQMQMHPAQQMQHHPAQQMQQMQQVPVPSAQLQQPDFGEDIGGGVGDADDEFPRRAAVSTRNRRRSQRDRESFRPAPVGAAASGGGGSRWLPGGFRLAEYKSSLLVAAIVFAMLTYVLPRMRAASPSFLLAPTGHFNALGLAVASALAGAAYRFLSAYV